MQGGILVAIPVLCVLEGVQLRVPSLPRYVLNLQFSM